MESWVEKRARSSTDYIATIASLSESQKREINAELKNALWAAVYLAAHKIKDAAYELLPSEDFEVYKCDT